MTNRCKTLITGGCGFVGRHLVDAFVARGDEVVVIDMAPSAHRDDVEYHRADITDYDQVLKACQGVDLIVHNASLVHTKSNRIEQVWAVNLGGTRNLMKAAREVGTTKFVYMSSASAVYEGNDIENGDETMPYSSISQAPYADSKIAAEKEVLAENGDGGLYTCAIRPHVIYGPGDTRFLPNILERSRAGTLKFSVGKGDKLSDFTYIDNLIEATVKASEKLGDGQVASGQAYFVTNGEPAGFWEFIGWVLEEYRLPAVKASVPYGVAYAVAAVAEAWDTVRGGAMQREDGMSRFAIKYMCTHHYFSIEKAKRDLEWEPKVSLREGIRRTRDAEATSAAA